MAAQIKGRLRHGYCAQTFGCAVIMGGRVRRIGGAQWRWEVFGPLARRRRPCRARGVEQEADRRRGDAAPRSGAACVVPGGGGVDRVELAADIRRRIVGAARPRRAASWG